MKHCSFGILGLVLLVSFTLGGDKANTGTIAGTVRYLGVVPPDVKISTTDGGTIYHNDLVVDPKSKGLRHVAVILEKAPKADAKTVAKKRDAVIVDQRDMVFLPRVVALEEGQKIRFENNDLSNHGVKADSTKEENKFDVVVQPNMPFEFHFKAQKNPVVVGCQLHAWMRAWVYVFDHPYFAVTDAQGRFRIERVPPGKHTLMLHHADRGHRETLNVEVLPGKTAEITLDWKKIGK
ncbi:MAG: carboxypeptidase regulatory-like domain-containing protein [Gemmataceae bacterium]|nr:carboxypeptidase regulatory-like domain-containing protein [Gemmataceae bacterium]MCI0743423.1 carboxypeptidase regulatory-like domain-containing protein [Gemmataceae bacterium]